MVAAAAAAAAAVVVVVAADSLEENTGGCYHRCLNPVAGVERVGKTVAVLPETTGLVVQRLVAAAVAVAAEDERPLADPSLRTDSAEDPEKGKKGGDLQVLLALLLGGRRTEVRGKRRRTSAPAPGTA
mgnify:CR=1 FL=1